MLDLFIYESNGILVSVFTQVVKCFICHGLVVDVGHAVFFCFRQEWFHLLFHVGNIVGLEEFVDETDVERIYFCLTVVCGNGHLV